jgi:signal transduction histidine kinase
VLAGIFLSVASWFLLRQSLDSLMLHELDERVDDVESFLSKRTPGMNLQELRDELLQEYRPKDEGKWLQVIDDAGNWLYFSSRDSVADPIPSFPSESGKLIPFHSRKKHSLRFYSSQVPVHGHRYWVSTAMSASRSEEILRGFRIDLWLMVPAVLLSAMTAGYLLSRKALSPVASIVAEARRINDLNLSIRVPVIHTRDELAELSETLNQMLDRIETAFRSVRSLTANASHELRTPLSLIRTRVDIALCFPRSSEQYRATLEDVQLEMVRMTSLVENLLSLARADAGTAQMELQPVAMTALVAQMVREWLPAAERLSLDLKLNEVPSPIWVLGNKESLQRLLRILLDNACRYTPAGGWIALSVEESGDLVTLAIEDSGIGIAEQDLPHIFERFYRAQKPPHQELSGSGLGLSLAKWIADQHMASVAVNSALGVGSCFRFIFPEFVSPTAPTKS